MSGHSAPVKTGYRLERLRDEAQNSASDVLRREHSVKRPLSILQRDSSSFASSFSGSGSTGCVCLPLLARLHGRH
ncbi:hypothetical protein H696_05169 [Fonticula alba]|uniref:Uncharacterized protein n=1 Tax=Fonticula alba TaxID=691883 RepID=A0A058Z280_FONAL|nr:hypothetical protein H696_05169 [Fonticula alba]KCV68246.1 hypothetical protein H696_05169 [Fonticula alba]|eukprot:XP_009497300.1 hypothetical protein H696_05169 [Fonticula alba]